MSNSTRSLKKLDDEHWVLTLTVDSREIESLKWIWTAEVSTGDSTAESAIDIARAQCIPEGMPEGDATGSYSFTNKLTNGLSRILIGEFESVLDQWEKECRENSAMRDSSVIQRRRENEIQLAKEERISPKSEETQ